MIDDLRTILTDDQLAKLRAAYDPHALVASEIEAFARAFPPLEDWNRAIARSFYGSATDLRPADRERCLIAMLTVSGSDLALAIHVYWGLMEGLSIEQVCLTMGLAGCYGGVPNAGRGLLVAHRTLMLLREIASLERQTPQDVHALLVQRLQER